MEVSAEKLFFCEKDPAMLDVYLSIEEELLKRYPGIHVKVQKTQITFAGRHGFAFVSLPFRKVKGRPEHYLILSLGLSHRMDSPRIAIAVEPYPNRWTHHVVIQNASELNSEILGWLDEAHAFSESKR